MDTSTADPVVSDIFNAPGSDMTIVSADDTHFKVHSQALQWSSRVFKDMFEVGGPTDGRLVKLAESADTLARVLVYIYPDSIPEFELNFPECLDVIRTLHKYQIWRGLEAVRSAFNLDHADNVVTPPAADAVPVVLQEKLETILHGYTFAALIGDQALGKRSLKIMLGLKFIWTDLVALLETETCNRDAAQKLVTSWGWNRLAALDAYTQVGIPKSCVGSARRSTCGYRLKDKWQALHYITDARLIQEDMESDCFECGPAFRKKAAAFKLKLQSLPELGFWNVHS